MAERKFTDLELERCLAGDLPAARVAEIEASPPDRERLEALRAENAAFLGTVDVAAQVRGIGRKLGELTPPRRAPWWRWVSIGGALAAAAALVLIVVRRPPSSTTRPDDIGIKGDDVSLIVHAPNRRLATGDTVKPGDKLRFEVVAGKPGYVAVVGVDGSGAPTVYVPFGGSAPVPFDPAGEKILPGAIALDATPGDERFFAVYSEQMFALGAAINAILSGTSPPAGVEIAEVRLAKQL